MTVDFFDAARLRAGLLTLACACVSLPAAQVHAQVQGSESKPQSAGQVQQSGAPVPKGAPAQGAGVVVDQVIAVVNGDLILESDVEEERHFIAFQPFRQPEPNFSRERAVERLVDRTLILQQAKLQPDQVVSTDAAQKQLADLRKDIPACKTFHCETDEGWQKYVESQGFTVEGLTERWRQRMEILQFIEMRFRSGITITPEQIKSYYERTLLPEYAKQGAAAPKLAAISDRVQEVLLQQQVSSLLADWLKSLKAQGTVRMMRPGEVQS